MEDVGMRKRGRRRLLAANCNPGQLRDADSGRCGPGIGVDIPRAEMPQIPAARLGALREFLAAEGVAVTDGWQPAGDLRPTQVEFRQGRVESISDGVALFQPVITSADDYVLDGTHRWIRAWQRGAATPVPVTTVGLPLREALAKLKEFPGVVYAENAAEPTINPFVSEAQRRWMHANHPAMAAKWEAHTPKGKQLPRKKSVSNQRLFRRAKRRAAAGLPPESHVANGRKLLRRDPTRTFTLRRTFITYLRRRFDLLKGKVYALVVGENAFGLTANSNPEGCNQHTGPGCGWHGGVSHETEFYRGMSKSAYDEFAKSGVVPKSHNANVMSTELETAEYYASPKIHEEPGVVVKFKVHPDDAHAVEQDDFVPEDFRITKPVRHVGHSVVREYPYDAGATTNTKPTANRYQYHSSPEKLEEFQKWLKSQFKSDVAGRSDEQLWHQYITQGFSKGAGRAFDDTRRPYASGYAKDKSTADVYRGGKAEFLRSSFGRPETREKVELLASRAFDELEDVTAEMGNRMSRVLADALVEGKSPRDAARDMTKVIDVSYARAEKIARTELIRAHAEGQLNSFDALGVAELGVEVEFTAADGACPECTDLDGQVFSIDDAHGMIPVHPDCRCCFRPAGPAVTGNRRGARPTANDRRGGTFFAECPRDERGHCLPATGVVVATPAELDHARRVAVAKALAVPQPTAADVEAARKGIAKVGVNLYRMGIKGNTADRRRRREALLKEFGDGHHCPCVYCGLKLGEGTLEQDKIITTAQGGRYKKANLVPACGTCNKQRGDLPWSSIKFS